ncbi:MAG: SpoIIE family protein phosphatase [Thermoanaerobaculales bacterium]|nr:SpoIIE family protein phosphatase [Thermoanaerobaculales bacterium]
MALPDLLRFADLALGGHSLPDLSEDLLREVVEITGSRAGVLRRSDDAVVRWPRSLTELAENATEGWSNFSFGEGSSTWTMRLLQVERLDEVVVAAVGLALRAWNLSVELKRIRFDKRFHLWELEAIRAIATNIGALDDPVALADELVGHLVALLGVRSAYLYLQDDVSPVSQFGPEMLAAADISKARQNRIFRDDVVALPLQSEKGVLGVLVVGHKEARAGTEPFASQDLRLLELFTLQVTVALEYARLTRESLERDRLQRELQTAATIQSHLLPQQMPNLPGFSIEARTTPSRHVAGDTYDLLAHGDDLVVTVTDVSGKGVGAGLIASGVQAGVRLLVPEDYRLEDLAGRLSTFLCGATQDNRFATFAMVRIRPDGQLFAVNAGHCPVLLRRRDGRVEEILSSGLPLGILETSDYMTERHTLEPGDQVILYTDGFTEAENLDEEEFGIERVVAAIAGSIGGVKGAVIALFEAVDEFTQGRPLHDDATLVVVEWLGKE